MSGLKKQITIITSTLQGIGRENAIHRFLEYHQDFGVKILVGVSDQSSFQGKYEKNVEFFEFEDSETIQTKLLSLSRKVETPYLAWVADDDFITGRMLASSCLVLNEQQDVVACDGLSVFFKEDDCQRVNVNYSYGSFVKLKKASKKKANLNLEDRLKLNAEHFHPMVMHGVIRKDVFTSLLINSNDIPVRWFDNYAVAKILSHGNILMLDSISNVRSAGTRIMDGNPECHMTPEIPKLDLVLNENFYKNIYDEITMRFVVTPSIKAAMDYFLLVSSGALNINRRKKIFNVYLMLRSRIAFLILSRGVRLDIKKIKTMMKRYPI